MAMAEDYGTTGQEMHGRGSSAECVSHWFQRNL